MNETKKEDQGIPEANKPPFYFPLTWPFQNVFEVITQPEKLKVPAPVSMRTFDFIDHVTGFISSLRSFIIAYAVVYWMYDEKSPYPAWGRGNTILCI